jgi:hypothetical protein
MTNCTFKPISYTKNGEHKVEKFRKQGQKEKQWLLNKRQENRKAATRPLASAEVFASKLKEKKERTLSLIEQKRKELEGTEVSECTFTPIKTTTKLYKTGTPKNEEDTDIHSHSNNKSINNNINDNNNSDDDFYYPHSSNYNSSSSMSCNNIIVLIFEETILVLFFFLSSKWI